VVALWWVSTPAVTDLGGALTGAGRVLGRFRVAGVRQEAPGIVSVYITGNDLDELRPAPGQFFRWRFLARGLWWQSHPYSLSASWPR
jgi:ferredoxin-NADP reductase